MSNKRSLDVLLSLRRLSETRAHERMISRQAALREAETATERARHDLREHVSFSNEHERRVISDLRNKVMTPGTLQNIQDELDALKDDGNHLARQVASAQSATRARLTELNAARAELLQKQREVMKLDSFAEQQRERAEQADEIFQEVEESETHAMLSRALTASANPEKGPRS